MCNNLLVEARIKSRETKKNESGNKPFIFSSGPATAQTTHTTTQTNNPNIASNTTGNIKNQQ